MASPTRKRRTLAEKEAGNWGNDIGPILGFASWSHRSGFYRLWKYLPKVGFTIWGTIFAKVFLEKVQHANRKIIPSLEILFPNASPKIIRKIYQSAIRNMAIFMMDMIFYFPNIRPNNLSKFVTFENLHYLDQALLKGKGVLMPSLHTGNLFQLIAGITYHPNKYPLCVIGNFQNLKLFNNLMNRNDALNLTVLATSTYAELKDLLVNHLHQNHIVLIYYDYTKNNQMRVPFCEGKCSYLYPTPQSIASLQKETSAEIVPVIVQPKGEIHSSRLSFLNPEPIQAAIQRANGASQKVYYGELTTTLNRIMSPYLRSWAHCWEEILNFGRMRLRDTLHFEANITRKQFLEKTQEKLLAIIENSYEPGRNDEILSRKIQDHFPKTIAKLSEPEGPFYEKPSWINLSKMSSTSEFQKLLITTITALKKRNEIESANELETIRLIPDLKNSIPSDFRLIRTKQQINSADLIKQQNLVKEGLNRFTILKKTIKYTIGLFKPLF
jgi:lauroyl/myristoyl acyltransferase